MTAPPTVPLEAPHPDSAGGRDARGPPLGRQVLSNASSTRCGAVATSDLDIVRRGDDSSATQLSGRRLRPAAEQGERGCATHQEGPRPAPGPAVVAF